MIWRLGGALLAWAVVAAVLRHRRRRQEEQARGRHPLSWPWETDPVFCELDEGSWSRP